MSPGARQAVCIGTVRRFPKACTTESRLGYDGTLEILLVRSNASMHPSSMSSCRKYYRLDETNWRGTRKREMPSHPTETRKLASQMKILIAFV